MSGRVAVLSRCGSPVVPPSTQAIGTSTTMSGKKNRRAPSATPWDDLPESQITPSQAIAKAAHNGIYAFRHERFSGDADFFNGYPRSECPHCGSARIKRNGTNRNGVQVYRCMSCGRTSTPITGTIFDNSKLPITAWVDFVLQAISFESIASMTREDRRADTTPPYWMAKVFEVLEGVQDDILLGGRVWIDESFHPVAEKDAVRKPDGKLPRGLSRNQLCIGVGTDASGNNLLIHEGFGKTNKTKTWDGFGTHIKPGSTLLHDMEHAHSVLVDRLSLESEAYDAKLLKGLPDELNPLQPVNRLCFLLKCFLRAHSGFNRDNVQGYLNLFSVAMNPPADKLEKAAFVLDRAMRCPKTLRFRDFYNVKPRTEGCEIED